VTGGILLLTLPAGAFKAIVPVLIALSCVLVLIQPWLTARVTSLARHPDHGGVPLFVGVYLAGVYGGYFGAAQGVLLIALLGLFLAEDLQRVNAAKNVLAGLVNGVAALLFILVSQVAWQAAVLIAVGSIVGAQIGARVGRRLPAAALRAVVVLVGVVAIVKLVAA
jgi:uncharacterized membrane protein YfcA